MSHKLESCPHEIVFHISFFMELSEIFRFQRVCKSIYDSFQHPFFWKTIYHTIRQYERPSKMGNNIIDNYIEDFFSNLIDQKTKKMEQKNENFEKKLVYWKTKVIEKVNCKFVEFSSKFTTIKKYEIEKKDYERKAELVGQSERPKWERVNGNWGYNYDNTNKVIKIVTDVYFDVVQIQKPFRDSRQYLVQIEIDDIELLDLSKEGFERKSVDTFQDNFGQSWYGKKNKNRNPNMFAILFSHTLTSNKVYREKIRKYKLGELKHLGLGLVFINRNISEEKKFECTLMDKRIFGYYRYSHKKKSPQKKHNFFFDRKKIISVVLDLEDGNAYFFVNYALIHEMEGIKQMKVGTGVHFEKSKKSECNDLFLSVFIKPKMKVNLLNCYRLYKRENLKDRGVAEKLVQRSLKKRNLK